MFHSLVAMLRDYRLVFHSLLAYLLSGIKMGSAGNVRLCNTYELLSRHVGGRGGKQMCIKLRFSISSDLTFVLGAQKN